MSSNIVDYDFADIPLKSLIAHSSQGQRLKPLLSLRYAFRSDEFWRDLAHWKDIDAQLFLNHLWQEKNAITSVGALGALIKNRISAAFLKDLEEGHQMAPMSIRLTPYILSLIDWDNPYLDPLRRQFLPLASEISIDHPMVKLDPMGEQDDSPAPGLTHRYPDRVLFLATNVCPVYCRYCTRSYAVGLDTDAVTKKKINAPGERWEPALRYIEANCSVEDVVISGGDAYRLKARQITEIGERLLDVPHVRRMRFATKGLAVLPMKIQSDHDWTDAISRLSDRARKMHKSIAIHTHFNHPNEITAITAKALGMLYERGVEVRNQAVILKGVNDNPQTMHRLNECLAYLNVRPYYCFQGDMIRGVEALRTSLCDSIALEKSTRGLIAGHNTPHFIVDLPGGGGKRDIHSYDYYDQYLGIAAYRAPAVKEDKVFLYCDPLHTLTADAQALWMNPATRTQLLEDVLKSVK
ncbi:KamA family radical SAM protein [Pseudomonas sp. St290]|uniref:KamA family radical SAM protein n=1 Tax=Pseudomonas sp. St290 TaxID=1602166 RepID=UPI001BB380A7|nr:KamA family radical SAM protein [Pseudomonas sp. St290]BBH32472.1 L-lysine 2,3-aminomutase [Pseudomonas sp. St290]